MDSAYRVILADPPWGGAAKEYRNPKRADREHHVHYDTMSLDALEALPIRPMAAKDSCLFLWTISTYLPDAPRIMRAWGFRYLTVAFVWVKIARDGTIDRRGLGGHTKQNAEYCLLGVRGNPAKYRKARDVNQIILARRREHSRKPDEQYQRIMRLYDGPFIELFARQQWPGWDVWGNQTSLFPAQPFLIGEVA